MAKIDKFRHLRRHIDKISLIQTLERDVCLFAYHTFRATGVSQCSGYN
jgi:hypothetical protein